MRPLRLSMKGFGAFREPTHIDLADIDLVAIVGPTGSGKSTIIDAITFALYGTVARYENNRLVAPAINQTSNEARVSLDFELSEQVFTAVRIVRRTSSGATTKEARLERDDEVLAGDARSMSKEVEALLRLDVEQFNRTVVLPQGKFATFLHDKPGDRQTTLVQLLGMELYRRIGQAARQRAARANDQVDALRPDLYSETRQLTDDRRAALVDRVTRLDLARSRFRADLKTINDLDTELRDLHDRIERLNGRIDRMDKVAAPAGLTELADQITKAIRAKTDAEEHRKELNARRRLANEAVENGPDVAAVQRGLNVHTGLARLTQEHDNVVEQLGAAAQESESARRAANQVREEQTELERCARKASEEETTARDARDAGVTVTQIDRWAIAHRRYEAAGKGAAEAVQAAGSAETALPTLRRTLDEAKSASKVSSTRVAELRRRAGVLGHVDLLEVGSDCPLCLQEVHELPAHDLDADLRQAEADNDSAIVVHTDAKQAYDQAKAELVKRSAKAASALETLATYKRDIADIPPSDEFDALLTKAAELDEALRIARRAARQAEADERLHGESTTYTDVIEASDTADRRVTRLTGSRDTLEKELTSLRNQVAALPSENELRAEVDEAERIRAEQREADRRFDHAEAEYETAAARLDAVNNQRERAIELLRASRDRVAEFGPPLVDTTDLVGAWATLTDWTRDQAQAAAIKLQAAREQQSTTANRRATLLDTLRARCAEVLDRVHPDAIVSELGDLLTNHRATAATNLDHFDRRRDSLRKLQKRVAGLTERAQVARKLGHLLRADGFESWLMEAALDQLVERATKRLIELSSGQYSLTVHKRHFAVRDHTNADEIRSARTLSGGETFLASLSLALALADAAADIAPEGAPRIESIFLDEGFGTLDPYTLDTVATAVEELGSTGRLVGIVTHIRELADRMPVRLEITKTGGSATVERVET